MKLKYFIPSLFAALAMLVACSDDNTITLLDEVQVSSSYVAIPVDGGKTEIVVNAKGDWEIDTTGTGLHKWLTISPIKGTAGETTVTFSAESTIDGRNGVGLLKCLGKEQILNIMQGVISIPQVTVAEVMNGIDSKTYQVSGTVTAIANTAYGNIYINDGTSDTDLYIYGLKNSKGQYPSVAGWDSFNIEVGDEITVSGPRKTYGSVIELVDATFISVQKSLIKVESVEPEDATIPTEGGDVVVNLANKGNGINVSVPEEAQSWLSLKSVAGSKITFHAQANNAAPRSVKLVFSTTADGKEYSAETTINQLGAAGSKELPFTVKEAIEYVTKLGGESATDVYVKGIVSKVESAFSAQYGNGTFWISEDGSFNSDLTLDFEGYRTLWLGNQKWQEGNAQIAVGAEVVLHGKITIYKGTAETSGNKAYVYSINGVETDTNGIGSLESPFNVAGAIAASHAKTSADVYIKGVVSKVLTPFSAQYGNGTFWISENGTFNDNLSLDFEAYRVLWLGNKKWADGNAQIAVNDNVVLHGKVTVYNGIAETAGNKAYVYSHNGVTE